MERSFLKLFALKILKNTLLTLFITLTIGFIFSLNIDNRIQFNQAYAGDKISNFAVEEYESAAKIIAKEGKLDKSTALDYAELIYAAARKYSLDPALIMAVISVESTFKHKAVSSGNYGLMQINYRYHREKIAKSTLLSPAHNINAGAKIMREYSGKSTSAMLVRYNGSAHKYSYAKRVLLRRDNFKRQMDKLTYERLNK